MFKLLVVEDEKWEREGLMDFLDWNGLGIEMSGVACDGIEGLDKARRLRPDIIITDIKMPGMDGLKMSRNIREFLPNVKIVILTGYDDFKLARDAINISANAYILKPVEEEELLEVMTKVLEECRKDARKIEEEKMLKELLDENLLSVKREVLSSLLRERPGRDVREQAEQLGILPACGRYAVIAAGSNSGGPREEPEAPEGQPYVLHWSEEKLFAVVGGETLTAGSLKQTALSLPEKGFVSVPAVYAGIGSIVDSVDELYLSCQQAKEALGFALFWGDAKTVSHSDLEVFQQDQAAKTGEFLMKGNYFTKQLLHSLRAADEERMYSLLDEMFRLVDASRWADRTMIANFLYGILNEAALLFYNTNLSELEEGTAGALLLSLPDYRSIQGYTRSFFDKAMGILLDKRSNKDEYVVKKVEQIVRERYHSDISIKTIAAEIYLSPNYLGSIFRKCTGIAFHDFLCQYRMEKAKELLQSPKYRVSKVAREVGISNPSYFCQLFKETFGIAPGEYQEMLLRGKS